LDLKVSVMDNLDLMALNHLMESGRASWSELSGVLNLSGPSTADRVKKLEEVGAIKSYVAIVDPDAVGCSLLAFIAVVLEHPKYRAGFIDFVRNTASVQECHHVTGEYDYLLKIRCQNTAELERLISNDLKDAGGIAKTQTIIALSTVKETVKLPINALPAKGEARR
jgi:Lrp/AsnC family transcriptional regulator, leucine-responsive regulatory protein